MENILLYFIGMNQFILYFKYKLKFQIFLNDKD